MAVKGEGTAFELIRARSNAQWLEIRKQGVGGSDVATIMGLNQYSSPLELWLLKTGRAESEDISDKPAVEWGNHLEPLIGGKYASEHPDRMVKRLNAVARSLERPWAQASLDYEVKDGDRWGILEIKTAGVRKADDWKDGVPLYYLTQITHYMSVLDRDFADVAVLIGGNDYREYRIERDEEDIQAVNKAVDTFWNEYVKADIMPEIANTGDESSALLSMYPTSNEELVEVQFDKCSEVDELISQYMEAKDSEKAAKELKDLASKKLQALIGDNSGLVTDIAKVTWRRSERSTFDKKSFTKDHPELAEKYTSKKLTNGGITIKEI